MIAESRELLFARRAFLFDGNLRVQQIVLYACRLSILIDPFLCGFVQFRTVRNNFCAIILVCLQRRLTDLDHISMIFVVDSEHIDQSISKR